MNFSYGERSKHIIKWAGGKSGILQRLLSLFPQTFNRYFEPFLGGGAVFLSLRRGFPSVLNDVNEDLILLYEVVRDAPLKLMKALDRLEQGYSEDFYYQLRDRRCRTYVDRAARLIFLNKTGFNGLYRLNKKGEFNVPFGKRKSCPRLYDLRNLMEVSRRLQWAVLECLDFEAIIDQAERGDFIYCDPPYEPLSRTSSFCSYVASGFSSHDQKRLRDACARAAQRGVFVAVSNSTAKGVLRLYSDFTRFKIRARRAINSKGQQRGEIDEICALMRPKRVLLPVRRKIWDIPLSF
jgi:DNA adenine methylase